MKRLSLTMILFCVAMNAFSTDCKERSFDEEYHDVELVFFCRVLEVNDTSFLVKVLESYKGLVRDTLLGSTDGRLLKPGSLWLFYAYGDSNSFVVDLCSGSKSLDLPYGFHDHAFPDPPDASISNNKSLLALYWDQQETRSLNEFYFEIETLRRIVRNKEIGAIQNELAEIRAEHDRIHSNIHLLQAIVGGILVLILTAFGLRLRNRS